MPQSTPEWEAKQAAKQLRALRESCDELMSFADLAAASTFDAEDGRAGGQAGAGFGLVSAYSMGIQRPSCTSAAYINEVQLRLIRALSRAFCTLSPQWKAVDRNRRAYIVGTGLGYSVVPLYADEPLDKDEKRKATKELDDFYKTNRYRRMQKEKVTRLDRDGEFFVRRYRTGDVLEVDFIEPLLILDPPGEGPETNCWYGVKYANDRYSRPIGYFVRPTNQDGGNLTDEQLEQWQTMVTVDDMQHRTCGVDLSSPRGLPLTYTLRARLDQALSTMKSMGRLVDIRARIALVRKQVNSTLATIQPLIFGSRSGTRPGPGTRTTNVFGLPYGTIYDTNDQRSMEFPSQNIETDKIIHAYKADLQVAAAAMGLADFCISADSSSSFASALVKEGPMDKCISDDQADMIEDDTELYHDALDHACEKGRLKKGILDRAKVESQPKSAIARNRIQEAQADDIYLRNGAMSTEAAIIKDDRDPDVELQRIKANPPAQYLATMMSAQPKPGGAGGPGGNTGKYQGGMSGKPQSARGVPGNSEPGVKANTTATSESDSSDLILEHSADPAGRDKPTEAEVSMAKVWITEQWLKTTKAEILGLPKSREPINPATAGEYEPGVKGMYLGTVCGQRVYAIDMCAFAVKHNCADTVIAGNSERFDAVPVDVIFVDWSFVAYDRSVDLLHECVEFALMRDGKWGYSLAHKLANYFERQFLFELRPELLALVGVVA